MSPVAVSALAERGRDPATAAVTIDRRALDHMTRAGKRARRQALDAADLDRLPEILADPRAVLFEERPRQGATLLYVFDPADDARRGKIAVRIGFAAAEGETNAVRTAGYVDVGSLRDPLKEVIEGEVE